MGIVGGTPAPVPMGQVVQGGYGGGGYGGPMYAMQVGGEHGPAEDPMVMAVVACFCCCWCIGILAICKSMEVQRANAEGDYILAHQKRKEAMMMIYLTVGIGIVILII